MTAQEISDTVWSISQNEERFVQDKEKRILAMYRSEIATKATISRLAHSLTGSAIRLSQNYGAIPETVSQKAFQDIKKDFITEIGELLKFIHRNGGRL